MASRTREALGWGVVGALAFLVLALGYLILADRRVALPILLVVTLVVFVAAAATTAFARPRLE